jgi:preprotein translocase subunit SecA
MRLFGSDRISSVMEKMGLKEGEVIQHPLISKSVERAQKKVEENNFSIRKRLLEYDSTMNSQREVIYTKRNRALQGDRLKSEIFDLLEEFIDQLIEAHFDNAEADLIKEEMMFRLLVDVKIEPEIFEKLGKDGLKTKLLDAAKEFYRRKEEMLSMELMARLERYAMLSVIDQKWKEHLREMDDMKEGIGLRAYGQKDPLVEYKAESFKLFVSLLEQIRNDVVSFTFKFFPHAPGEVQAQRRQPVTRLTESKQVTTNIGLQQRQGPSPQVAGKLQPIKVIEKVGRNDPCPCGSGKKFKQCHGK